MKNKQAFTLIELLVIGWVKPDIKKMCIPGEFLSGVSRFFVSDGWDNLRKKIRRCRIFRRPQDRQNKSFCYNSHSGFTLIELLVVVLIIGILAAVALPQYKKAVMRSRFATLKTMANAMADAEEVYYLANGSYTRDTETLTIDIPADHNDGRFFYFNGGYCLFTIGFDTQDRLACVNEDIGLAYEIHLQHSQDTTKAGARTCVVNPPGTNQMAHQLCKQETGTNTPWDSVSGYIIYRY